MGTRLSIAEIESALNGADSYNGSTKRDARRRIRTALQEAYAEADEAAALRKHADALVDQNVDLRLQVRALERELEQMKRPVAPLWGSGTAQEVTTSCRSGLTDG